MNPVLTCHYLNRPKLTKVLKIIHLNNIIVLFYRAQDRGAGAYILYFYKSPFWSLDSLLLY